MKYKNFKVLGERLVSLALVALMTMGSSASGLLEVADASYTFLDIRPELEARLSGNLSFRITNRSVPSVDRSSAKLRYAISLDRAALENMSDKVRNTMTYIHRFDSSVSARIKSFTLGIMPDEIKRNLICSTEDQMVYGRVALVNTAGTEVRKATEITGIMVDGLDHSSSDYRKDACDYVAPSSPMMPMTHVPADSQMNDTNDNTGVNVPDGVGDNNMNYDLDRTQMDAQTPDIDTGDEDQNMLPPITHVPTQDNEEDKKVEPVKTLPSYTYDRTKMRTPAQFNLDLRRNRGQAIADLMNPNRMEFNSPLDKLDLTRLERKKVEYNRKRQTANNKKTEDKKKEDDRKKGHDDDPQVVGSDKDQHPGGQDRAYNPDDSSNSGFKLPIPYVSFNGNINGFDVKFKAPTNRDFDDYVIDISTAKPDVKAKRKSKKKIRNRKGDIQKDSVYFNTPVAKDNLCRKYDVPVYVHVGVERDGKVVAVTDVIKVTVPALNAKSKLKRRKLCDYKEAKEEKKDKLDEEAQTNVEDVNRFYPDLKFKNKIKVKVRADVADSVTGRQLGILRPAYNKAIRLTKDQLEVLVELDNKDRREVYQDVADLRNKIFDRIHTAYPNKYPVFKAIFVRLRDQLVDVKVDADATMNDLIRDVEPDIVKGLDIDKAGAKLFDINFEYALAVNLANRFDWSSVQTSRPSTDVEMYQEDATDVELEDIDDIEVAQDADDYAETDLDETLVDEDATDVDEVLDADEVAYEYEEEFAEEVTNQWDYSYEYDIPEFDFSVCQSSYDPVADGTFQDLAYDANNVTSLAAHCLKANNIIGGYLLDDGNVEYRPNADVNRAEAAKFLMVSKFASIAEVLNQFEMVSFEQKFMDVPGDQWYTPFVTVAERNSVIKGYGDGRFRPGNTVNTAEFFKMLVESNPTGLNDDQLDYLVAISHDLADFNEYPGYEWSDKYFGVVKTFDLLEVREGSVNTVALTKAMTRGDVGVAIFKYLRDVTPSAIDSMMGM